MEGIPREVKDNHVMQEYTNTRKMGMLIQAERSLFAKDALESKSGEFPTLTDAQQADTRVTRAILQAMSGTTWFAPMRALYLLHQCWMDDAVTNTILWRSLEIIFLSAIANMELNAVRPHKPACWDIIYATDIAIKLTQMIENINQVCDPAAKQPHFFMHFAVRKTVSPTY